MIRRRMTTAKKATVLYTKRFYPAGTYSWTVPAGCKSVDVFLVGAGGGAGGFTTNWGSNGGGGGGYTKAFRGSGYVAPASGTWEGTSTEGRDGNAIAVTPGEVIQIIVGAGVGNANGGYSQFKNSSYRALGGYAATTYREGGNGGSAGGTWFNIDNTGHGLHIEGASDGGDCPCGVYYGHSQGSGQGHTTRDFGESNGLRNAGGGAAGGTYSANGGASDYSNGKGGCNGAGFYVDSYFPASGGGGYGGGASNYHSDTTYKIKGGDGTVLIRYYAY